MKTKTGSVIQAEISDLVFSTKHQPNMTKEQSDELDRLLRTRYCEVESLKQWLKNAEVDTDYHSAMDVIEELLGVLEQAGDKQP